MDDLNCVWKNLRESYMRFKRDHQKNMCLGAKAIKLPSRQFCDIIRFLEQNTDQENHYVISYVTNDSQQNEEAQQNEEENDIEEETGIESVGWRSLKPVKRKQGQGFGNTDQKNAN